MATKYLFTTSAQVEKTSVVVLQRATGAYVLRHFAKTDPNPDVAPEAAIAAPEVVGADLVVCEDACVYSAAALSRTLPEGLVFRETHQQWVNPEAMRDGLCWHSELYDFVALVAPIGPDLTPQYVYNHFVAGAAAKASVRRVGRIRGAYAHAVFAADTPAAPLSDWTIVRYEVPGVLFIDQTDGVWQAAPEGFSLNNLLPAVACTAPTHIAPDAYAEVQVALTRNGQLLVDYTGELVAEPVAGYCPKHRIQITAGVGQLRVGALGLTAGDDLRVKIGTRNVSGLADVTIAVA